MRERERRKREREGKESKRDGRGERHHKKCLYFTYFSTYSDATFLFSFLSLLVFPLFFLLFFRG
jgi:hypothetical protein